MLWYDVLNKRFTVSRPDIPKHAQATDIATT
jgi:hypothetical protein